MKIAILGTRGIPNRYGGFEQFAGYLSMGLVGKGHEVFVYNSHNHAYQQSEWNNVHIIHCYDPENKLGSAGQFIYDLNCILDARKRNYDIILMLGYTSSSIWGQLYPKKSKLLFNMDGMEWKRSKYSRPVQRFLFYAEKLAIKFSDFVIADSKIIQSYLDRKYAIDTKYIPYGAKVITSEDDRFLKKHQLTKYGYYLTIGRMVCENNLDMILQGFTETVSEKKILVIGDPSTKYGKSLVSKYHEDKRIVFTGSIYNEDEIHTLKLYSELYFHGHSVGGTNPCLLEAMASKSLIAAHHNDFNKSILRDNAFYFSNPAEVKALIEGTVRNPQTQSMIDNNLQKIMDHYNWDSIVDQYENFMIECCNYAGNERHIFHT